LLTTYYLGIVYQKKGKDEEAERMLQRALDGFEKTLGPDHIYTVNVVNRLGHLHEDMGNLASAQAKYRRALTGFEKALGLEHKETGSVARRLELLRL
jgi:tetratricopeptide (TPR) repeat protein